MACSYTNKPNTVLSSKVKYMCIISSSSPSLVIVISDRDKLELASAVLTVDQLDITFSYALRSWQESSSCEKTKYMSDYR